MSILIKGLKMPSVCDCCWALDESGDYPMCRITGETRGYNFPVCVKRMDRCPLISVPDHGDLIDRDALMTRLGMAMDCEDCPNRTALYFCGLPRDVMEVCDELENTPVVIPEERSEDETD